VTSWS